MANPSEKKRTAMLPPGASELTLRAIDAEVTKARLKHPANAVLLAALMEEVGELANALIELRHFVNGAAQFKPRDGASELDVLRDAVQKECIQVACVAVRILEEGTGEFPDYRAPGAGK